MENCKEALGRKVKNIKHLPKFLIQHFASMWFRIRKAKSTLIQCCGSGMFIRIPDPNPDPHQTQKIVSKFLEIWSGMFIPDPDFFPSRIPDPDSESRGQKSTGSATLCWFVTCLKESIKAYLKTKLGSLWDPGFRNQENQSMRIRTKKRTEYKHILNMTLGICDIVFQRDQRTHIRFLVVIIAVLKNENDKCITGTSIGTHYYLNIWQLC